MSLRKRQKVEQANEIPLQTYQIPRNNRLGDILDVMEAGNVELYCTTNQIRIRKVLLVKSAILMVECNYKSQVKSKQKSSEKEKKEQQEQEEEEAHFITVEKSRLFEALKEVLRISVLFLMLSIFEDRIQIISYDKDMKEVAKTRVSALMSSENFILEDPGSEIKYDGQVKITGKHFIDSLPTTGKQLNLEFDKEENRLILSSEACAKDLDSELYIYLPKQQEKKSVMVSTTDEEEECYEDHFGDNGKKLLKQILELFKEKTLIFKFNSGFPLHFSGAIGEFEKIKFYMVGLIPDD